MEGPARAADASQQYSAISLLSKLPLPFSNQPFVTTLASSLLSYATSQAPLPAVSKGGPELISMLRDTAEAVKGSAYPPSESTSIPARHGARLRNPGKRSLDANPEDSRITDVLYEGHYSRPTCQTSISSATSALGFMTPPPSYEGAVDNTLNSNYSSPLKNPRSRSAEDKARTRPRLEKNSSTRSEPPVVTTNVKEVTIPGASKIYSISQVLLKGREQGTRTMLKRYLFSGPEATNTEIYGEVMEEDDNGNIGRHGGSVADTEGVDIVRTTDSYDAEEINCSTNSLCNCTYCVKGRELRWQLFLLQEKQRSNQRSQYDDKAFPSHIRSPSEPILQLSPYPEYPTGSSQPFNISDQGLYYCAPPQLSQRPAQAAPISTKQKRKKALHFLSAKVTFSCILIAHFLYPHIKAFIQELLAYEREHKITEKLARRTLVLMSWLYRSVFLVAMGFFLMLLGGFDEDDRASVEDEVSGGRNARAERPKDIDIIKGWIKTASAEIVGGMYEGIEAGIKICRERNDHLQSE